MIVLLVVCCVMCVVYGFLFDVWCSLCVARCVLCVVVVYCLLSVVVCCV